MQQATLSRTMLIAMTFICTPPFLKLSKKPGPTCNPMQ